MEKRRKAKIAAISCTHSPFTPPETHNWILDQLANIPDLTHFGHLGDVFESSAASVHAHEDTHTLEDEYEHGANFLKSIREVLPSDCNRWINTGNHDDNILAKDPRRIPSSLRSLVDWRNHPEFGEEFQQWYWVPYEKSRKGVYKIGQCLFYHGFDCSMNSDELEGLQMMNCSSWLPHGLTVRGHTHRPVPPTQSMRTKKVPLPFWYANVGTCGPLKPNYAKRKDTSLWGSAIIVIECVWDRPSKLNGKCWEAELIRMDA